MKNISKHLISFGILGLLVFPVITFAQTSGGSNDVFGQQIVSTGLSGTLAGAQDSDPRTIIARIINIALGFLGVIAVGIILLGGFKWMTAAGNEDKTTEAKQLLGAGVIGLIIILSAWALATFVINQIYGATTGNQ